MEDNKDFMHFYDESVDNVFSYYYEKTHDRGKSLELTQAEFEKAWDTFDKDKEDEQPFKGTNTRESAQEGVPLHKRYS